MCHIIRVQQKIVPGRAAVEGFGLTPSRAYWIGSLT